MKTTIIALSAAALIAAAPTVLAQAPSKTPGLQHRVSKKHHPGVARDAPRREMQVKGLNKGYPGTFCYAPSEVLDKETEIEASRQAGGGGGGGGGSGM